MRAAFDRVDVIGEREDRLLIGVVPLHRDLDLTLVAFALEVDEAAVDRILGLVDVRDEVLDATLVVELDGLAVSALVDQFDVQPAREKRGFTQALRDRPRLDVELLEDLGIGKKRDRRSGVLAVELPDDLHIALRNAALELLAIRLPVAPNPRDEPLGERVHD